MFYLALRQLLSRKRQTLLILLGISFGTMIYVLIAGVQLGFRDYIQNELLNSTSHVIISARDNIVNEKEVTPRFFSSQELVSWITPPAGKREESNLENYLGWEERLDSDPHVRGHAPKVNLQALASLRSASTSIILNGIIPEKHTQVTQIAHYMQEGSLMDISNGGNLIILGTGVLKNLGARVGDTIFLSSGKKNSLPYKISGSIHFGNPQVDDSIAFAHLNDVQSLGNMPGRITEILVSLYDINLSNQLAHKWDLYSIDKVESWEEANAQFMSMIKIQDIVRMIITLSILLVAGFGIYNVLSIMIGQKQKEIAILRSIGYGPHKILELFLIQGIILGFSGGTVGLTLGFCLNLFFGSIDLGIEIGQGRNLIISYAPSIYLTAFLASLAASFIASYLPAKHASKLTPIEIIRSA